MARAIIVIPTYNEAENLPALLPEIMRICPDVCVLISDDASPDGTAQIAQTLADNGFGSRIIVMKRTGPRGYGRACLDGFNYAIAAGYDYVLTMDADLSHEPRFLPDILRALDSGADMVSGSRYSNGVSVVNWPLRRIILSIFANWYVRTILRLPIKDCTSGFRGYRSSALQTIDLSKTVSDGYAFLVEMATRIDRAGLSLRETPFIFVERRAGQSKMSKRVMFESALLPWKLLFCRYDRKAVVESEAQSPQ